MAGEAGDSLPSVLAGDGASAQSLEVLREAAKSLDFRYEPVAVRGWLAGIEIIAAVRHLRGTVEPVEPFHHWTLFPHYERSEWPLRDLVPDLMREDAGVNDFHGLVELRLDGSRYLLLRLDREFSRCHVQRATIIGAPSLEAGISLAGRLTRALSEIRDEQLRVYGTRIQPQSDTAVNEDEIVLPKDFRASILDYLDGFFGDSSTKRMIDAPPSRGVLLVGQPGTGKTLMVRHLLTRFSGLRRFIFMNDSAGLKDHDETGFVGLVRELCSSERPAIVVIEDIDRLFEAGTVTPQFLLNVLDGLFRPPGQTLWVATSNDPSGVDRNLLDRPGRFDRVWVFPQPALAQRVELLRRFSPWPVEEERVSLVAELAGGLSGAHLREVCISATLAAKGDASCYGEHLEVELERVLQQHRDSRAYGTMLKREDEKVGFGS